MSDEAAVTATAGDIIDDDISDSDTGDS